MFCSVRVTLTSAYYLRPIDQAGLLLGYASMTETEIRAGIRRLAGIMRS